MDLIAVWFESKDLIVSKDLVANMDLFKIKDLVEIKVNVKAYDPITYDTYGTKISRSQD